MNNNKILIFGVFLSLFFLPCFVFAGDELKINGLEQTYSLDGVLDVQVTDSQNALINARLIIKIAGPISKEFTTTNGMLTVKFRDENFEVGDYTIEFKDEETSKKVTKNFVLNDEPLSEEEEEEEEETGASDQTETPDTTNPEDITGTTANKDTNDANTSQETDGQNDSNTDADTGNNARTTDTTAGEETNNEGHPEETDSQKDAADTNDKKTEENKTTENPGQTEPLETTNQTGTPKKSNIESNDTTNIQSSSEIKEASMNDENFLKRHWFAALILILTIILLSVFAIIISSKKSTKSTKSTKQNKTAKRRPGSGLGSV